MASPEEVASPEKTRSWRLRVVVEEYMKETERDCALVMMIMCEK